MLLLPLVIVMVIVMAIDRASVGARQKNEETITFHHISSLLLLLFGHKVIVIQSQYRADGVSGVEGMAGCRLQL